MLEVSVLLPASWIVQTRLGGDRLTCVADDGWEDRAFRPSITVERYPHQDPMVLPTLATSTLATMERTYAGFELRWSRADDPPPRVVRSYEFTQPGTARRIRQLQGLVAGEGLFVVNCSESASDPRLEDVFERVVGSVIG
jgi:hypothetical protein